MANEQNLVPFTSEQSREEAVKNGQKGGIASGQSRRARKTLRAELEILLSAQTIDKETGKKTESTVQEAVTVALVKQALKGNTKAFEIIRDTIGEKPVERVTLAEIDQATVNLVEKMVTSHDH
jgi:chorismate synthase